MPKRTGSLMFSAKSSLKRSTLTATRAAARIAWRLAVAGSVATPKSARRPSPEELVRRPAGLDHGLRHGREKAIDDEHDVVRHPLLGEPRRAAHVDEHAHDVALLATACARPRVRMRHVRIRGQERHQDEIGPGPQLAGEAHRGIGVESRSLEHGRFGRRRRRQRLAVADDADPARGAAAAAAAHARMGDVETPARFEHRESERNADRPPVRIREPHHAAAAFQQRARAAGDEHQRDRTGPRREHEVANLGEGRVLLRRAGLTRRKIVLAPFRQGAQRRDGATRLVVAEERERGQQHRRVSRNGAACAKNGLRRSQK